MLLSVPSKVPNRILLERVNTPFGSKLLDSQAGFRLDRSCPDHIATQRIIIELSLEWNSSLYVNSIDYKKRSSFKLKQMIPFCFTVDVAVKKLYCAD